MVPETFLNTSMYFVVAGFAETDVAGRIAAGAEDGAEENGAVATEQLLS